MANLRLYTSGSTVFQPSPGGRVPPDGRSAVSGWSKHSIRSLVRWLYSVDLAAIETPVWSFTFTVRDCPHTPNDWKRLRESFFRRCAHQNIRSIFWLTEWQRRGVPHLHGIVILPADFNAAEFGFLWVRQAEDYGARPECQFLREIYDPLGWSEYLGKHSARGIQNYQRASAGIPAGWLGKTGRMWGYRGDWPTTAPIDFQFSEKIFFKFRRLIRSRAVSLARSRGDKRSMKYARTMLRHSDSTVSRVRGLSVFVERETMLLFCDYLTNYGSLQN